MSTSFGTICKHDSVYNKLYIDFSVCQEGTYFIFIGTPGPTDNYYFSNNINNNYFPYVIKPSQAMAAITGYNSSSNIIMFELEVTVENSIYNIYFNDSLFLSTEQYMGISSTQNNNVATNIILGAVYLGK